MKKKKALKKTYAEILDTFGASVVDTDCGQKCRHLNDGIPVCCDTGHAIPIMSKSEWKVLKARTDLWHKFIPETPDAEEVISDLDSTCLAVECKGVKFCERDNRSLSCRAFPFFPYIDKDDNLLGLSYYWTFEDRCWVISNMKRVQEPFVQEFIASYESLFEADPGERQVFKDYSATMRRVFSRKKKPIYVIGPDMRYLMIKPKGAGIERVKAGALPKFEPYA